MVDSAQRSIGQVCDFLGSNLYLLEGREPQGFSEHMVLRARSLAKAAYLRALWSDTPVDDQILQSRFELFESLVREQALSEQQQVEALNQFTAELVQFVQPVCPDLAAKEVLKQIAQAESYSIVFHDRRADTTVQLPQYGVRYQVATKAVDCMSVEHLYRDLENESWYQAMPDWEQQFLSASVAEDLDFYTLKTPTTKRRPGASNFGRDELSVGNQHAIFHYHSVPSKQSQEEATAVIHDYFDNYKEGMIADFRARHHEAVFEEGDEVTIPLLMESLLTPAWYEIGGKGDDNNTRMLALRAEAVRQLREDNPVVVKDRITYRFNIIDNNQPLNGRRSHRIENDRKRLEKGCDIVKAALTTILDHGELTRAEYDAFAAVLQAFEDGNRFTLRKINLDHLSSRRYGLLVDTLKAYTDAWKKGAALRDSENHALYLTSCESILVQEVGGAVELNCKSSKDRVGLAKAHNTFMRAYYVSARELPRYGKQFDNKIARDLFNDLVATIPAVSANTVAPGCAGIKNESLHGAFIAASTVRDIFWWKDNYAKNVPEFFRRANSKSYTAGERFGYGLLGFFSTFLPFLMGPIIRAVSFDAMVPSHATKTKPFKSNKRLAKTNKVKAKSLTDDHVVNQQLAAVQQRQPALVVQAHETVSQAVTRYLAEPEAIAAPVTPCFGQADHADLKESLYHDLFAWKAEKAAKQGIRSQIVEHQTAVDGYAQHTLMRDAREMQVVSAKDGEKNDAYSYAELAATYGIAAETIFDMERLDPTSRAAFQAEIKAAVHAFKADVIQLETAQEQCAALDDFVQSRLAVILARASNDAIKGKKAVKYLDNVKNWVALYQPAVAVSTVDRIETSNGSVDIIRTEEPLTALTPELRAEYENCQDKDWYRVQSAKNRQLIDHFMPHILRGHQIPSQLRKYLPGLKNAYKSSVYIKTATGMQKLSHSNHCAAIVPVIMPDHAYLDKLKKTQPDHPLAQLSHKARDKRMRAERIRLTQLGMLQQRAVTGSESNTMVALNSEWADLALSVQGAFKGQKMELLDREMALVTIEAAKGLQDSHGAKVCLNGWNRIEPNRVDAIQAFSKQAQKLHKKAGALLTSREDAVLLAKVKASIKRLNRAISKPWRKRERKSGNEFTGVSQVQEFTLLSDLYNRLLARLPAGHALHKWFKSHEPFYACASGENRTGIIEMAAQVQAVASNLSVVRNDPRYLKGMYLRMAQSGHLQYITGSQGGIMGAESFRDKSMGSLPDAYREAAGALSKLHAGYKSASGGLVRGLLKKLQKKMGSTQEAVAEQVQLKKDLAQSVKPVKPCNKKACLMTIQQQLKIMESKAKGAQVNYIQRLLRRCDTLLQPGLVIGAATAQTYLIKHLKTLIVNAVVLAAKNERPLPASIKQLSSALSSLTGDEQFKAMAEFNETDMQQLHAALKSNEKNKSLGMLIGAGIGLGVAVVLTGPLAPILAAKFAMIAKAKVAVDLAVAAGGAITGRARGLRTGLLNRKTPQGFFARIKDVMRTRLNLAPALQAFKHMFGLHKTSEAYINNLKPTAADLETVTPSELATIGSDRSREAGCFVMTVNLGQSHSPDYKPLHQQFKHEVGKDQSNNLSLAFDKNDLRQVRVEQAGRFTPAEKIVDFMRLQGKKAIKLTGVLDDLFVAKVVARAKQFRIAVIDERINKPQPRVSIIQGRPCASEAEPVDRGVQPLAISV
jgi:hypothetical protein